MAANPFKRCNVDPCINKKHGWWNQQQDLQCGERLCKVEEKLCKVGELEIKVVSLEESQDLLSKRYEEQDKNIEEIKNTNSRLQNKNDILWNKINILTKGLAEEQLKRNRREMIKISGIPHEQNEDCIELAHQVCTLAAVDIKKKK